MKRISGLTIGAVFFGLASGAQAADLPAKVYTKAPAPVDGRELDKRNYL